MAKKEFELINRYFKPLIDEKRNEIGLRDDCAVISEKFTNLTISKDILAENVHFLFADGAKNIAKKLLLSNISDNSASGAVPKYYMLGFSFDERVDEEFMSEFCQGLREIQEKYKIAIVGGDTVKVKSGSKKSGGLFFSVTIFGEAEKNLLRKNAKDGDLVFVTGSIGDSYLGLKVKNGEIIVDENDKGYFLEKHFSPCPNPEFAFELAKSGFSSCAIDVSDGFLADLKHICEESKVSCNIFADRIPISKQAQKILDNKTLELQDLLSGGEDYELIFTANKKHKEDIFKLAKKFDMVLNEVGFCKKTENYQIRLFEKNGDEIKIKKLGYEH